MKILHIGLSETLGGIERFLVNVYNNKSDDISMDFITKADHFRYDFSSMIPDDKDYRIFHIAKLSSPFRYVFDIYRIIKKIIMTSYTFTKIVWQIR